MLNGSLRIMALSAALCCPFAALAASPSNWTAPYLGVRLGVNNASTAHYSSGHSRAEGLFGGYARRVSSHLVMGAEVFYQVNETTSVTSDRCSTCMVKVGTDVYGLDWLVGAPIGSRTNLGVMPYLKIGYAFAKNEGDHYLGGNGNSASALRYGIGIELRPGAGSWGVSFQGMWQRFGDVFGYQDLKNQDWTVGLNYRF